MSVQEVVQYAQLYLLLAIGVIAELSALIALVHAASTRPDAFSAVDAQSKTFWVALLAGANALILLFVLGGMSMSLIALFLIAVIATMVYIVDVRVRVDEILNRNWFRKLG
ncbi:hypothetical protein nbrc107696_17410 [Gordonia spumicola]|uniref:DUF2516 domain-containing protein n=1 Tax=Gordonia spumicola TaxID=589161 RepID=A0A7I9V7D2_9ACTN|nr:DUF2516 family protein [Gordonia spumicola]GEE01295.1 hypothetical protein nbrc107696_17410 [Gordonia spumicola]